VSTYHTIAELGAVDTGERDALESTTRLLRGMLAVYQLMAEADARYAPTQA
jgi:hypothetical protein